MDVLFNLKLDETSPFSNNLPDFTVSQDLNSFFVPITSHNSHYRLNWKMIDDLIDFVNIDLITFCLLDGTQKSSVIDRYGLVEYDGYLYNHQTGEIDVKMKGEEEKEETSLMMDREARVVRRDI